MAVKGIGRLLRQFSSLEDVDHSDALLAGADVLKRVARLNSPVDTGKMKSEHSTRIVDKDEAVFEVLTDYAIFVEYDQPWVRPAIDMSQARIVRAVQSQIDAHNREAV